MEYEIVSDGSCDLAPDVTKEKGIKVVPFYVTFDGMNYKKEMEEIGVREFYQQMVDKKNIFPKSSLPSVGDYISIFTEIVKQGKAVLCICITTKFSGSYNSACNAKEAVLEEYPEAVITVIDSQINTVLQGLFVLEAVKLKEAGVPYEQAIERLEQIKETGRIFFTIGSIDYLKAGGRIGKLMGLAGSTLGIKPLIELKEGEIFPFGITRSREKSKKKVIEQAKQHFDKIKDSPDHYSICVGYGYDYDEAVRFRDELLESMKDYSNIEEIPIFQIGATIGVHTGPYPIGLALIRKGDMG